jgi:microsomal dipeptidase-like Zn-dependent dipeptidase
MHLLAPKHRSMLRVAVSRRAPWTQGDRLRASLVGIASKVANYRSPFSGPRVTVPKLRAGGVGVALCVLYSPFDEIDVRTKYPGEPQPDYLPTILRQLDHVEQSLDDEDLRNLATVVRNPRQLDAAIDARKVALVPCIEGGFHVGPGVDAAEQHVRELAQAGVAYITVAHLFYRRVATNANAIPFIPDRVYRHFWPQPEHGLTELGRSVIRAMVAERVLIDVTHMSGPALDATFTLLDDIDPDKEIPVLASHGAVRFKDHPYNLSRETIEQIVARNGVIGLILGEKLATADVRETPTETLEDSLDVLFKHVDRIQEWSGPPQARAYDNVAIGTDLDGFVKPTLAGLQTAEDLHLLESALIERYGPDVAAKITTGNALRLLRGYWRGAPD